MNPPLNRTRSRHNQFRNNPKLFSGIQLKNYIEEDAHYFFCSYTKLFNAILINVKIKGANLTGVDLSHSNLTDVDLHNVDLTQVNIKESTLTRVNFSECIINPQSIKIDEKTEFNEIKCDFVYFWDDNIMPIVWLMIRDLWDLRFNLIRIVWRYNCIAGILYLHKLKFLNFLNFIAGILFLASAKKRYPPNNGKFVRGEFEQFIKGEIDMNYSQENKEILDGTRGLLDGTNAPYHSVLKSVVQDDAIKSLKKEVDYLENRLKSLELQEKLSLYQKGSFWPEKYTAYIFIALFFIVMSGFLWNQVKKDNVQISIEYDVGVLMGGVLTGTAALIAATSYAKHNNLKSNQGNRERNQ